MKQTYYYSEKVDHVVYKVTGNWSDAETALLVLACLDQLDIGLEHQDLVAEMMGVDSLDQHRSTS